MRIRIEGHLSHSTKEFVMRWIAGYIRTQNYPIADWPDQSLYLGGVAVRDAGGDSDVLLMGAECQKSLKRRCINHERADVLPQTQRPNSFLKFLWELHRFVRALRRGSSGARTRGSFHPRDRERGNGESECLLYTLSPAASPANRGLDWSVATFGQ